MVFKRFKKHAAETTSGPVERVKIELAKEEVRKLIRSGIYSGFGWSIGVTLGFAAVSTILVFVLGRLGGLPLVGGFFASIVEETQGQLSTRSVYKPSKTPTPTLTLTPSPTPTAEPTVTATFTPTPQITISD